MKPIRVGLIRCDMHGMYYGALMAKHDPLLLREPPLPPSGTTRHSWQTGGAHFYFYTHYANPRRICVPTAAGFRLVKLWDENPEVAESAAAVFYGKPTVCDTFQDVSDDVDMVFIADCNGDGSDHLKLATPGLKKRVPTFVDKPFAFEAKEAVAIVRLAKKHKTPVLSMSILRSLPHFERFRKRFDEVGGSHFGTVKGGGTTMAGHIHAVSVAQLLFGNGVESVACMGENPLAHMHLNYGGRKGRPECGVVLNCDSGPTPHCAFFASVYGPDGAIHTPPIGDFQFPWGATRNLNLAKKMVRTGKCPVAYDDIIENVAVATAARRAQKLGRAVKLREVWRR